MTREDNVIEFPQFDRRLSINEASAKLRGMPRPVARQVADLLGEIGVSPEDRSKMLGDQNGKS